MTDEAPKDPLKEALKRLTSGAQRVAARAVQLQEQQGAPGLLVRHWLAALLERHAAMLESLVEGLAAAKIGQVLASQETQGPLDEALPVERMAALAEQSAAGRGRSQPAERDLAAVTLAAAGYTLAAGSQTSFSAAGENTAPQTGSEAEGAAPALEAFGHDLTAAARQGKLGRLSGREEELDLVVETLCRRTKRNPALIGPAGVGKTAIAEGLARRIVDGQVPEMLRGARLVAIQPSVLVAGVRFSGELEKRVQGVLQEASRPGVILFIDEIHTIMGAGGIPGLSDLASMLKPALARGELACIAATTNDEYRRYIEADGALERRFQPIRIQELTPEQTLEVLRLVREDLQRRSPVQVGDEVLAWLVDFARQYMRNRYFPDKGVDLLEQSFAYALRLGRTSLELADARRVAHRMVGLPLSLDERIKRLEEQLQALLPEEERARLLNLLQVTLRGLDLRTSRPNAVLLFNQDVQALNARLAAVTALALYGGEERVVDIDLSSMQHPADINLLVGAPPGYIGHNEDLPLHALLQTPSAVLRLLNLDLCHPVIRQFIARGISEGRITDGRGRAIYFSDTIILLTTSYPIQSVRSLGFQIRPPDAQEASEALREALGKELFDLVDIVVPVAGLLPAEPDDNWVVSALLPDLSARYEREGLQVSWDQSLIDWLNQYQAAQLSPREVERWVNENLIAAIVPYLKDREAKMPCSLSVSMDGSRLVVAEL